MLSGSSDSEKQTLMQDCPLKKLVLCIVPYHAVLFSKAPSWFGTGTRDGLESGTGTRDGHQFGTGAAAGVAQGVAESSVDG